MFVSRGPLFRLIRPFRLRPAGPRLSPDFWSSIGPPVGFCWVAAAIVFRFCCSPVANLFLLRVAPPLDLEGWAFFWRGARFDPRCL